MFKALLCIPPDYEHNFPPLGTPALSAFLKNKGIDVAQIDLNLKYRDFLIRHMHCPNMPDEDKKVFLKAILKKFFYENLKDRYYSSMLPRSQDGISPFLPYDNNSNSSFYFTERLLSSEALFRYLEDSEENTFYQFFQEENFLTFLDKAGINLLGISIISPSQAIASLTLGLMVKKNLPHIHVAIGGQWPTLYRNVISARTDFFQCFDSVIVFEGETPFFRLVEALKAGAALDIPNLMLKDNHASFRYDFTGEDLDQLPCPDFDGLPLDDYDARAEEGRALTFETSRGCYWAKCAYCVDLPLPKPSYRRKNPALVVRDIRELKQKYAVGHLMLGDPGLSCRQMLEVSQEIIRQGIEISWWSMARLDPGFSFEAFKLAYQAGLKQINFGFESASDHLCELLDKGIRRVNSQRIIRECSEAGIKVCLQTMLGLPHETMSDGLETVDFLIKNKAYIREISFNLYYLTPENFIYRNPDKYSIRYEYDPGLPFRFFTPFDNLKGMTENEACLLQNLYARLISKSDKPEQDNPAQPSGSPTLKDNASEICLELKLNSESCKLNLVKEDGERREAVLQG